MYESINNSTAVLVPAHNEELVISKTLQSILNLVSPDDLYVIDDGSKDNTSKIAKIFTKNVLSIPNRGKAVALNTAIKYFNLTKRYKYILFMDADTMPDKNFLKYALKHFEDDSKNEIVCVVGRVKGFGINWISKFRQWEYQISHLIHKKAQGFIKSIVVLPGCATIYKSFIFDLIKFPTGTLTEDMDFTFTMHRLGFNKMVFENKAIVFTQDPQTLRDYSRQLHRWYTGFWQVVRKHNIPWQGQTLDLEVSMLAIEGLYNGLLVFLLIFSLIPLAVTKQLTVFKIPVSIDFFLFFIPTLLWSSFSDKDYLRVLYIPHFYFLRVFSCVIFLSSFFRGYLSLEKEYTWQSRRNIFRKEEL